MIHSYSSGWQTASVISDPPVPGALKWLRDATQWWDVQIFSSRSNQRGGIVAMQNWLMTHAMHEFGDIDTARRFVAELTFPTEKPAAMLTIDDRAIQFDGDWSRLDAQALLRFKPWNKR